MSFATMICCMDGRIQLPAIKYLQNRFEVDFIDNITTAGPVGILSQQQDSVQTNAIEKLVKVSVDTHQSSRLAVVAHQDCAGNPIPDSDQKKQIQDCLQHFSSKFPQLEVIGLWIDGDQNIQEFSLANKL